MLKTCIKTFLGIFFPHLCFYCHKKIDNGHLCRECTAKITPAKITAPPSQAEYQLLICAVDYKEPVITLIHKLKYHHCKWLAQPLAKMLIDKLSSFNIKADLITCVPSHPAKIKERGYNPPALLAKNLANHFSIPFIDDIIYQYAWRESQTKISKDKRANNAKSVFTVKRDCTNKVIVLVDDVYTTGATMNSCCRALKEKGASKIIAVTLAKTYEDFT